MPVVIDSAAGALQDQPGSVVKVDPATGSQCHDGVSAVCIRGVAVAYLYPTVPEQPSLPPQIRIITEIAVVNHTQTPLHERLHGERLPGHEPLNCQALAVRERGKEHLASDTLLRQVLYQDCTDPIRGIAY